MRSVDSLQSSYERPHQRTSYSIGTLTVTLVQCTKRASSEFISVSTAFQRALCESWGVIKYIRAGQTALQAGGAGQLEWVKARQTVEMSRSEARHARRMTPAHTCTLINSTLHHYFRFRFKLPGFLQLLHVRRDLSKTNLWDL